jgi:group I intron endonuclease
MTDQPYTIYRITNTTNGKVYIGLTTGLLSKRISAHFRNKRSAIGMAIQKYGRESFVVEVLDTASSLDQLHVLEKQYISLFKSNISQYGYNITEGGDAGYHHSGKTKLLIGTAVRGVKNGMFGKPCFFRGKQLSAEHIANMKKSFTPARRDRMSLNGKLVVWDDLRKDNLVCSSLKYVYHASNGNTEVFGIWKIREFCITHRLKYNRLREKFACSPNGVVYNGWFISRSRPVPRSHVYFANYQCQYYPCHQVDHCSCLFCFCPLYLLECPNPTKDCEHCIYPHQAENYDAIIEILVKAHKGRCRDGIGNNKDEVYRLSPGGGNGNQQPGDVSGQGGD